MENLQKGLDEYANKNYQESIRYYNKLISLDNNFYPAYANCALSYLELNNFIFAHSYSLMGLQLSNYSIRCYRILERIYKRFKMYDKIEELWKDAERRGTLNNWLQRSEGLIKSLNSKPWYDNEEFKFETQLLVENHSKIVGELKNLLEQDFSKDTENLTDGNRGWKKFYLYHKGVKNEENCKRCPETTRVIEKIENATSHVYGQIEFSKLEPGTHIIEHCSYTNSRIRIHLGLIIPEGPEITVGKITKKWIEGDCIILDDSFIHEVHHRGTEDRYILIVDVWHKDLDTDEKRLEIIDDEDKWKYKKSF